MSRRKVFAKRSLAEECPRQGFAVVLGTDEVASAIAAALHANGWAVALSVDPQFPVLRRGASYYDVLFGDEICLDTVRGCRCDCSADVSEVMFRPHSVAVTPLDLSNLIVVAPLDLLIDARRSAGTPPPDLRWLARFSVGIGGHWRAGANCDAAVHVPEQTSLSCQTLTAARPGYWYTPIEPGMRIYRHLALGNIGGSTIRAPCDGVAVGILRDGLRAGRGAPLIEIDRRLRCLSRGSLDPRGRTAARSVLRAVKLAGLSAAPDQNFLSAMPCLRNA